MSKEKIQQIARASLSGILDKPGTILYSSHETLKSGGVYLLGFNPGGTGGDSIQQSIDSMLTKTENYYLDQAWENNSGSWAVGCAPLQQRVRWILENIGFNPKDVCASNLIFLKSREAADISYSLAEKCWPVHEAILSIVRPKLIIAFGNSARSPYGYLHSMFGGKEEFAPSGHGNWSLKSFSCHMNDHLVSVVGLPHLSRYSPVGKNQVVAWLLKHLYQGHGANLV